MFQILEFGIDTNTFKLCDSYENAIANPPVIFDIPTITGSAIHTFEKINPQILVEKNDNLVFNLTDNENQNIAFGNLYMQHVS